MKDAPQLFPVVSYKQKFDNANVWLDIRRLERSGEQIIKDHNKAVERLVERMYE